MDEIGKKYPDLKAEALAASEAWNALFKAAEDTVWDRFAALSSEKEPETNEARPDAMLAQAVRLQAVRADLATQVGGSTPAQAGGWIKQVMDHVRTKGATLDSPQREMLSACLPRFIAAPEEEFRQGHVSPWTSKDKPRSQGIDVSLIVPLSWKDIGSTGSVARWVSDGGHGRDSLVIGVRKLPALSPEALEQVFSAPFANKIVGDFGAECQRYSSMTFKDQRMGVADFTHPGPNPAGGGMRGVIFYVVQEDTLVTLAFGCFPRADASSAEDRLAVWGRLVKLVLNSLALPSAP